MTSDFTWRATYQDGTEARQFDDGVEQSSLSLDRERLKFFELLDEGKVVFKAPLQTDGYKRKLIYRRRVSLDGLGELKGVVYLVGWNENVGGVSTRSVFHIFSDGSVEITDGSDVLLWPSEEF